MNYKLWIINYESYIINYELLDNSQKIIEK